MNRQTRTKAYGNWVDRGSVSFEKAAALHAIAVRNLGDFKPTYEVEVRDEAEPEIVHTLVVTRHETYSVAGLRGGE